MAVLITFEDSGTYAPIRLSSIPMILGRSSKAGLKLNDGMCSGQHVSIQLAADGNVIVTDLSSTNGTYINETLVSMASKLFVGDVVRIGDTKFSIDESSLTPKEKSVLVSDTNKTSFTTIGLPSDSNEAFDNAKKARLKATGRKDEAKENNEVSEIVIDDLDSPPKNDKLAMVTNDENDEAMFELGESSGKTKMIKLDKIQPSRKKAPPKKAGAHAKKKSLEKESSGGFMSKVKGLFNKD